MLKCSALLMVLAGNVSVFAQAQAAKGPTGKGGFSDPSFIFMMVAMFVIIYFFMLRPQAKKQKETQKMLQNLKKGDKVLTVAGIVGIIGNVKESTVMVKVADSTVLEFKRAAISAVLNDENEDKGGAAEKDAKASK